MQFITLALGLLFLALINPLTQPTASHSVVSVKKPIKPVAKLVAKPKPVAKPVVQPAPVVSRAVSGNCSSYLPLIEQYPWDVQTAVAICQAESGGDTYALSSTGDRGIFQVNFVHSDLVNGDLSALYNPAINVKVAYEVYSSAGWRAWSTYNSGAFYRFL